MEAAFHAGMQVVDRDGRYAGTVEDVLSDEQGMIRYLVVRDRGVFSDDVVLPASGATVEGETVRYPMTRDDIHKSERFDEARFGAAAGFSSATASRFDRQDEDH